MTIATHNRGRATKLFVPPKIFYMKNSEWKDFLTKKNKVSRNAYFSWKITTQKTVVFVRID